MTKPFTLQPLLELMQNRADEASKELGRRIAAEQDTKAKLNMLIQYRDEYAERFRQASAQGLSPAGRHLGELAVVASLSKRSGDGEYVHGVPPDPLMLSSWCHMVARSTGRCLVWR